jgi:hypothetical protein
MDLRGRNRRGLRRSHHGGRDAAGERGGKEGSDLR